MELTRRSFLGADDAGAATGLTGCAAGAVGDAPVGGPIEGATSLLTPILLTTLEPTGLLDPLPSTANALDCAAGHGIAFTAETVPLSTLHKKIRHGELTADAAAVPIDRRKLITVVAGHGGYRRAEPDGGRRGVRLAGEGHPRYSRPPSPHPCCPSRSARASTCWSARSSGPPKYRRSSKSRTVKENHR